MSTHSQLKKAGSQVSQKSIAQSIISKLKEDRAAVKAIQDKYTRKTSLFGSEDYKEPVIKPQDKL